MLLHRLTALRILLVASAALFMVATAQAQENRTWTDGTGRFKLQAKLLSVEGGNVILQTDKGRKMTIALEKLSKEDQEFVKKSGSDNPFQPAESSPFAPVQPESPPSSVVPSGGPRVVQVNWTRSKAITLPATGSEWELSLEEAPSLGFTPKPVALPPKTDFFEKLVGVAISPIAKKAVVGYTLARPGNREATTRVVLCDLEGGRITATATATGQMTPIALHDDGRQILMRRNEFGFGKLDRLEVWTITGKQVAKSVIWTPYEGGTPTGGGRDVMWAEFLDANTLATSSRAGRVAIWNFATAEPLCHFDLSNGSVPGLSADRKWIAFASENRVGIFDVQKQDVAVLQETPSKLTWPFVAFSPTGRKIGCIANDHILVWDTASGRLEKDFATPGIIIHGAIDFPKDEFILANNQYLIALESQLKLWHYQGAEYFHSIRGATFLAVSGMRGSGILTPARAPHPAATALLEKALKQPDLFIFREGTTVKLDVSGIATAQRKRVEEALSNKLSEMNCKASKNGTIDLVATVDAPKSRDITYMHSGTYKVKEYRTRLKFVYQGTTVWEVSATNIPGFVMLKKGENLEGVLRKASKEPSYAFYDRVVLPKFLQKPATGQRPGAGQTLGSCQVTPSGYK